MMVEEEKKRNVVLEKIESRLGILESSVQTILDRGDEFNEATQEKLSSIQEQIEEQSANMRKLRRKLGSKYSSSTVAAIVLCIILIWSFLMYNLVGV